MSDFSDQLVNTLGQRLEDDEEFYAQAQALLGREFADSVIAGAKAVRSAAPSGTMNREDFDAMAPSEQMSFIKRGGTVADAPDDE